MPISGVAPHIGRETRLYAKGQYWTVGRFDVDAWDNLLAWAAPRIPNPLEDLKPIIASLPPAEALKLIGEVRKERPQILTIDTPIVQKLLFGTVEGGIQVLYELLKKHHPDISRQTVLEILQEAGPGEIDKAMGDAAGHNPPRGKKKGAGGDRSADADGNHQLAGRDPGAAASLSVASLGNSAHDAG